MRSRFLIVSSLCLAASSAWADSDAKSTVAACDQMAAISDDPDRPVAIPGVKRDAIDVATAILVCRQAVAAAPAQPDGRRVQFELGRALDGAKSYAEAKAWYEKAAVAGSRAAMYNLAALYDDGNGVPQNKVAARVWYEKAAALGDPDAIYAVGTMYQNGEGVTQDYVAARTWYEKAAAMGNSDAMSPLGAFYRDGNGVAQNYVAARVWFEKAAGAGRPDAMIALAELYSQGLGVTKDDAAARGWYAKAAATGDTMAMVQAGQYDQDHNDDASARRWFEKAATAGNGLGMTLLAAMYLEGNGGLVKNEALALEWFEKGGDLLAKEEGGFFVARVAFEEAAKLGAVDAMVKLGDLYDGGKGGDKDDALARKWYEQAAAKGSEDAKTKLAALPK